MVAVLFLKGIEVCRGIGDRYRVYSRSAVLACWELQRFASRNSDNRVVRKGTMMSEV